MDEDNEWKNLPLEDKCVHKSWKARSEGYEAATRLFQCIDDDKSPEWSKYAGLLKKFVADSNLTAQEKGLDAVLAYVENYVHAGKTVGEVMPNLVQKCISSSAKPKTKDLAVQISLMYIEKEKHELVIEELLKGTESKNPKTSCGCLKILSQALREFGPKVVMVSKILKKIPTALTDRDKNVRTEARAVVVEIYRWVGPPLKQQLGSLKSAQMSELEAEFEKLSGPPPQPTRLLRSQQAKKVAMATAGGVGGGGDTDVEAPDEANGEAEIDPTEFLEPVDVLSKLPKTFFSQLEEKKWTVRREALEALDKELQAAPRLEPVDYGDLVRALKKVVAKDSNIVVVAIALKCFTGLTNGLKKKFLPYVGSLMPTLLEKFKEKKQNIVSALRETVDAIFLVAHLESIQEDLVAALDNKNPCVKNEVSLYLARCFTRCTPAILNKKLLKILCGSLLKVLNDSDPGARDAAAAALGTAMKVVGEKGIGPFLADIGEQKMSKIKSCCDSAELQKPIKVAASEVKTEKAPSKTAAAKSQSRPQSKIVRPLKKESSTVKSVSSKSSVSDLTKKLQSKVPSEILNDLGDSDDNKRLLAFEELFKYIESKEIDVETVASLFEVLPSLNDDNQVVVETKIKCMKTLAEKNDLSGIDIKVALLALLKKYDNPKFNECVASCLASFSHSLGNDLFVQSILHQSIISDKNVWASSLKWISEGIINYNLTFSEDYLQKEAKKAIKSGNLVLRNAGLAMVGTLHMMNKDDSTPEAAAPSPQGPTKSSEPKKREIKSGESSPSKTAVDITTVITPAVLAELCDDSWKTKLDALERVKPQIENLGQISPNLGEIQTTFENLLVDKNTKVIQSALTCLAALIKGLGIHSRKYACFFLPKVLKNLSDPKVWVRNCVIVVLDAIGSSGGYKELFDNDTLADTCSSLTLPAAKVELYTWITQTLNRVESVPSEGLVALLPVLYQSLEDRSGDIRKASNETIITLMMHLGYDTMYAACSNLKGSTAAVVKNLLDKNRGNVPEVFETPVSRSKSGSKLKKPGPGSTATYTKPSKTSIKSSMSVRTGSSKREDSEPPSDEALMEKNNLKHQRIMDEQKLRTLKWNFTSPRSEFIEQIKDQMNTANFNQNLIVNMFHSDFRYHIKAIEALTEDLDMNRDGLMSNLDLILRWMTLRFFDTNPSVLIKGLEYLILVFNVLIDEGYNMLDIEAMSFLPYLILKAGDSKDTVKNHVRSIFKQIALLYPRQKVFGVMLDGLKSKNSRLRAELLEMLCWMINTYSVEVFSPNVVTALKEIGRHIGDKDTSVRNGALNCMVATYYILGEDLHKYIGSLPNISNGLLEERLKRASKNRPVPSITLMESADRVPAAEPASHSQQDLEEHQLSADSGIAGSSVGYINNRTLNAGSGVKSHSQAQVEMDDTYMSGSTAATNMNRQYVKRVSAVQPSSHIKSEPEEYHSPTNQEPTGPSNSNINRTYTVNAQKMNKTISEQDIMNMKYEDVPLDYKPVWLKQLVKGKYRLDDKFYQPLPKLEFPDVKMPDISFLKEPRPPRTKIVWPFPSTTMTTSILDVSDPVIKDISEIDLEKAITAMAKIETTLYSDKADSLKPKMDYLIHHLTEQLRTLNDSSHPDVVNCYRGNFSLILKLCDNEMLCREISEGLFSGLLAQLLLLLSENRLEKIGQELFVKTVNNIVLILIGTCSKTPVMCSLIGMLHEAVKESSEQKFQNLIIKCLWKINRDQATWDNELDYPRVLYLINKFLVEFPSSWWQSQEREIPLKTIRTILHSMVKIRGTAVRDELSNVPNVTPDSELGSYIRKLIRHLASTDQLPAAKTPQPKKQTPIVQSKKSEGDVTNELLSILKLFENSNNSPEALKLLHDFHRSHPEVDLDHHLISLPVPTIMYIKKGLVTLDTENGSHSTQPALDKTLSKPSTDQPSSSSTEDTITELLTILKQFENSNESPEALKLLHAFKTAHPDVELDPHLMYIPVPAVMYIKRGLVTLDLEKHSHQIEHNNYDSNQPTHILGDNYTNQIDDFWKKYLNDNKNVSAESGH